MTASEQQASCGQGQSYPWSAQQLLFQPFEPHWEMMPVERCALILLLQRLAPECVIEIGTRLGGSLSAFAQFSKKVYTLDIDPTCQERLGSKYPNVEFVTGRSQEMLPPLLARLQAEGNGPQLILVDGDHTPEGARHDIDNALQIVPQRPLAIVMHDSFNPDCRDGIAAANWRGNPYVHAVDLDFVPGIFTSQPDAFRQMWGGFALAWLLPVPRSHELVIEQTYGFAYELLAKESIHRAPPPPPASEPAAATPETEPAAPEVVSIAKRIRNRWTRLRQAS